MAGRYVSGHCGLFADTHSIKRARAQAVMARIYNRAIRNMSPTNQTTHTYTHSCRLAALACQRIDAYENGGPNKSAKCPSSRCGINCADRVTGVEQRAAQMNNTREHKSPSLRACERACVFACPCACWRALCVRASAA